MLFEFYRLCSVRHLRSGKSVFMLLLHHAQCQQTGAALLARTWRQEKKYTIQWQPCLLKGARGAQIWSKKVLLFLSSLGSSMLICFLSMKRQARDIFDTLTTHADLIYVTDADCWAQNGSTQSHVFATFKHQFNKQDEKLSKKPCWVHFLLYIYIYISSWWGPWCFFGSDPL